jgi:Tfp pilus assembly protein PilZ
MVLGLGRTTAPVLAPPKGILMLDYLIVVASQFKFAEPLRQGLEGLGVELCEAESWKEARDLLEVDDNRASLAIIDAELVPDFAQSSAARPQLDPDTRWPIFLISEATPNSQLVSDSYRAGFLGYLSCDSPLEETLFRVRAYLENSHPRHYTSTPRASVIGPVRLILRDDDAAPLVSGLMINISRTGMMLRAVSAPEVGTRVTVSFWLPQELQPISLRGRVVWLEAQSGSHTARSVGIEYEETNATNQNALLDHVLRAIEDQTAN